MESKRVLVFLAKKAMAPPTPVDSPANNVNINAKKSVPNENATFSPPFLYQQKFLLSVIKINDLFLVKSYRLFQVNAFFFIVIFRNLFFNIQLQGITGVFV